MSKFGIDARLTYYRAGGISTYIRRLILALESFDSPDETVVFRSRKAVEKLGTRFANVRLWTPSHHRLEPLALSVELTPHRLDVLHSPDFIPPLRGARRHVITVHDLNFLHYPQFLTDESRRYYNGQIEGAVRQADHILADSEATRQDMMTMLGVPGEKITVHMLGVDESFKPLPADALAAARKTLELPETYFLFLGTFEPRKNIPGLLAAYQALYAADPSAPPLVLAGNRGWMFDETMAQIQAMNLGSRVLWRENIPQALLPALYGSACALVTPSFYEGFGLPALEAMACGTVPIVSNRSSLPEVVGDVGAQIDPDDPQTLTNALRRVLNDAEWRSAQQSAGLRRAATFNWNNTARIVQSVYQSLVA